MPGLRQALFLALVACSQTAGGGTRTTDPAAVVAVPLTAASAEVALAQVSHGDLVPPWSLTASDGSGLMLTKVEAKAVFEGPLAFTELHLYFHNSEDRRREGTFAITLPAHAAVSRFAMENDGQWMEAELVEKQLARRAYDDFLHRRQDPALLEKAEGNQFTAKVFPIAPKADKHIVISFSQLLPGAQYVLPLRGLPKTEAVDVSLAVTGIDGKRTMQMMSQRNWTPDKDFVSQVSSTAAAVSAGNLVAMQVAPFDETAAAATEAPKALTMLVDTSASRALGYDAYVKSVRALIASIAAKYGAGMPLDVIAYDQDHEAIFRGRAGDWGDAQDRKLVERGAAGASDLAQALASLDAPNARVLVVTDGVITAGDEGAALAARVAKLGGAKVARLDIALAGGIRDDAAASALVHAGLAHAGAVLDLDGGAEGVATALAQPVKVDVPVDVPGAAWVYPRTIPTARPGQSTMVYARLEAPAQSVDVVVGGQRRTLGMLAGTQPLVERAVGGAEIEELEARLVQAKPEETRALKDQITKLSLATRVVSSQTSLLVLESDDDYARYGIDRRALADVLTIGPRGIERLHRSAPAQLAANDPQPKNTGETKVKRKLAIAGKDDEARAATATSDVKELALDAPKKTAGAAGGDDDHDGVDPRENAKADKSGPGGGERYDEDVVAPAPASPSRTQAVVAGAPPPPPAPPPRNMPAPSPEPMRVMTASPPTTPAEHRPMPTASRGSGRMTSPVAIAAEEGQADGYGDGDEGQGEQWPPPGTPVALTGELAQIEHAIAHHDIDGALHRARDWHAREPGDVLALIGLGDALEAKGSAVTAARIYGSIIDLFPGRADLRRFAGERIERVMTKLHNGAQELVIDTYRRAVEDRPDHMTGHRLLAYAYERAGRHAEAFAAILAGLDEKYPDGRFAGGERTLGEDAGMIGAAYAAAAPGKRGEITAELAKRGLQVATGASTRFILYWETDANDVDFHIQDAHHGHAYYAHPQLASGGELYADITTGYGPECFAIQGKPTAGPYRLSINYFSQGPMGYGMGLLEVQRFDGKGGLTFEDRPYVIMNDHAFVDLGTFKP